ncbi:MAG: aminotransferase class I/II-fold pyridoxal phosphate-dependent enzyme, partial [Chloroflexota bacterium]
MGQRPLRPGTQVVRLARTLPPGEGTPVAPPLVQSVAFDYRSAAKQDEVFGNERAGYVYGRYGTPTTAALEMALAALDGADAAVCFTSGMAAVAAFVDACAVATGGRILAQEDVYGQVRALFERWVREHGAKVTFVDATDTAAVEHQLAASPTALLYVEAIANPLLRLTDIAALARIAHAHGATLAVDATFASPVLVRPIALGADVVIHSLTKYVNGHGDVMGGSVAGSAEVAKAMRERTILDGAYLPPHEAWLCIRGMRTLDLRVRRQCDTALRVATHLAEHPKIARVRYPGLTSHPQHDLAARQFGGLFGGVVTFDLRDATKAAAFRFLDALELA